MLADYSSGPVGIGVTAPIWGAIARRYPTPSSVPAVPAGQWSLVGDAVRECARLQSVAGPDGRRAGGRLDRRLQPPVARPRRPTMGATRLQDMFAARDLSTPVAAVSGRTSLSQIAASGKESSAVQKGVKGAAGGFAPVGRACSAGSRAQRGSGTAGLPLT